MLPPDRPSLPPSPTNPPNGRADDGGSNGGNGGNGGNHVIGTIHGPHQRGVFRDEANLELFGVFRVFNCTGRLMTMRFEAEPCISDELHAQLHELLERYCPSDLGVHGPVCPFDRLLLEWTAERHLHHVETLFRSRDAQFREG